MLIDPGTQPPNPDDEIACAETPDIVTATIAERGKIYGDPRESHTNIGLAWTALINQHYGCRLDHPLPPSLVAQMMVAFKMQRAARVYHADNYVDAHAYTQFTDEFQQPQFIPPPPFPSPSVFDMVMGKEKI